MRTHFTILILGAAILSMACPSDASSISTPVARLIRNDLASLQNLDTSGFQTYDQQTQGAFSEIFGGTARENVLNYLNQRVRFYALASDVNVSPAILNQSVDSNRDPNTRRQMNAAGVQVVATNVGTVLWLEGLVGDYPVTFTIRGEVNTPVRVTSTRTGLVVLSTGYVDKMINDQGQELTLPPAYRQMTLMHEARHSDCSGGISRADIANLKLAASAGGASLTQVLHGCGHTHVICPRGHQYQGLAACDGEAWGAYQVGAVFAAAVASSRYADVNTWEFTKALYLDSKNRVLVSRTGRPDMSSWGLTGN
jgi:hypothetical protein